MHRQCFLSFKIAILSLMTLAIVYFQKEHTNLEIETFTSRYADGFGLFVLQPRGAREKLTVISVIVNIR